MTISNQYLLGKVLMLSFPTGPGTGNHYALGRPSNPPAQLAYIHHLGHKKGQQNYLDYTVHTVTLVDQTKRETTQILSTVSLGRAAKKRPFFIVFYYEGVQTPPPPPLHSHVG